MKYFSLALLLCSLTLVFSCTEGDEVVVDVFGCDNNSAEYAYNDSLITTSFQSNESDVVTPNGVNCGIGAVIDLNANRLTLRIHAEDHSMTMGVLLGDLNDLQEVQSVTYIDDSMDSPFTLAEDGIRMFTLSEMNTSNMNMMGSFNFVVRNSYGLSTISSGEFTCEYQSF